MQQSIHKVNDALRFFCDATRFFRDALRFFYDAPRHKLFVIIYFLYQGHL
ncbi:MAG: hypothetical protein WCR53_00445 [Bacteroidaceae bacterium]